MKRSIFPLISILFVANGILAQPKFKFEDNQSFTWEETIEFYRYLSDKYENCKLTVAGETDAGKPLHLFIISGEGLFTPEEARNAGKAVLLINNGIHPGEPCGVDASAKFALDILQNQQEFSTVLDSMVICIIPVLNVGGALNRGEFHRANQNGPELQGFRANATNNDLNRDFVKLDTRNARSFIRIIRDWDPDIMIDTHTSNGSDYQYVITLITTQQNKLNAPLNEYLQGKMVPTLFQNMEETPYEMSPYVMSFDRRDPKNGIIGFMDYPRYTSGYASLFNTIGFTIETHMFKPFRDRVLSTYHFLNVASLYLADNKSDIRNLRAIAREATRQKREYVLQWSLDTSQFDDFLFKGYDLKYRTSKVTGLETYYFDRESPWEKSIRNYNNYVPAKVIRAPEFYIVPAAWRRVVELLELNKVEMYPLQKDTLLEVEYYYINDFKTTSTAYNGHYLHSGTTVRSMTGEIPFLAGDLFIPVNQSANEFIVQVLEPEAVDSYFNWNFFDPILSRQEYFSPYVFDDKAADILIHNVALKNEFETKLREDSSFANDHYSQLRFIYERSEYSENVLMRYPVARFYINK